MAYRTTEDKVIEVLGPDYQQGRSLTFFIRAANGIITRVVNEGADEGVDVSATVAADMETVCAAWLYTKADRIYTSRSTLSASGSFNLGKNQDPYMDMLNAIDPTGLAEATITNNVATMDWLGKTEDEALTYAERIGGESS